MYFQEMFVILFNYFRLPRRHGWLLLALGTAAVHAQPAPPNQMPARAQASLAPFQSALEGFKPYTDDKTGNWKGANDVVAGIGGWRAYAKEAAQPDAGPDPHAGHGKSMGAKP